MTELAEPQTAADPDVGDPDVADDPVVGPAPGTEIAPGYRLLRRLATGKRAVTYDAVDHARRTRCVVKLIRADRSDNPRVRRAIRREGVVLRRLRHPHLVAGYGLVGDVDTATGQFGFAMEAVSGMRLDARIASGPLSPRDVAVLGSQLASALQFLHADDLHHLDLKPSNVIVQRGHAVLIDLSLMRRAGPAPRDAGTKGYLAPEQSLGADVGGFTDVWGLGLVLREALTGVATFGGQPTWGSGADNPLDGAVMPAPTALPPALDAAVAAALDAAVAPDPAARPTMLELLDVLAAAVR